ncbi:hypothetical protein DUI87_17081 [Hirundo rustica rustica]|uniref:Protein Wnt n=2 Tax=Hirundo rustica TaxID=43150 RepID=A0A3M0K2X2_HIRRU|nr:hypothetical protein DUI87_17081 [Hirundo rustica rustica]
MKVECKCHGVSGSCWKVTPSFRQVGSVLKEKFEGATELYPKRVGSRKLLVPESSLFKPCTAPGPVYLRASPDFCHRDPGPGILGASGCQRQRTPPGTAACSCWCCSIECKQRRHLVEGHRRR